MKKVFHRPYSAFLEHEAQPSVLYMIKHKFKTFFLCFKAYVAKTSQSPMLFFSLQSIKPFSRGDAFECYVPQIRNTHKAIHIVNQGNLSVTSLFEPKFMPTKKILLYWKDRLASENKSG